MKKHGVIISDKESDALNYNRPKKRAKEFAGIRIYQDDRIEELQHQLNKIKQDITTIKQQISAHDYNIVKVIKGIR